MKLLLWKENDFTRMVAGMAEAKFPMRINKYLALKKYCTRREADEWIEKRLVFINGTPATLGQQVALGDTITIEAKQKTFRYIVYNKPRGILTHSPQGAEKEIKDIFPIPGVFPVGRLDKDSSGLIILTDDGRVTDALLNPAHEHEKEYEVRVRDKLPANFKNTMEAGVDIGDFITKPCRVRITGNRSFSIILTEGKNRQIRRMCTAVGQRVEALTRTRILCIGLGRLKEEEYRFLGGKELKVFLTSLGLQVSESSCHKRE